MERILKGLQCKSLLFYLDDMMVLSPDFNSHIERLEEVLQQFRLTVLELKPSKYDMFQTKVCYLGHVVNEEGFQLTQLKSLQCGCDLNLPTFRKRRCYWDWLFTIDAFLGILLPWLGC